MQQQAAAAAALESLREALLREERWVVAGKPQEEGSPVARPRGVALECWQGEVEEDCSLGVLVA